MTVGPVFVENWVAPSQLKQLTLLARYSAMLPEGEVAEVGVWTGQSLITIAEAVPDLRVHAIDTFAGSPSDGSAHLAGQRDILREFLANVQAAGIEDRVVTWPHDWRDVFAFWPESYRLRFVHIDGDHSFEEVDGNIAAIHGRMVPGGVVCGDDYHAPGVHKAARRWFGSDLRFSGSLWWCIR